MDLRFESEHQVEAPLDGLAPVLVGVLLREHNAPVRVAFHLRRQQACLLGHRMRVLILGDVFGHAAIALSFGHALGSVPPPLADLQEVAEERRQHLRQIPP